MSIFPKFHKDWAKIVDFLLGHSDFKIPCLMKLRLYKIYFVIFGWYFIWNVHSVQNTSMLLHTNTKLLDRHFRYNKAAKMTEFRTCRRSKVPYVIPPGQGVNSGGASTQSSALLKNKIWDDVIHLFCRLNRGKCSAILSIL